MNIIFVRHGHPDYKKDCLTELGHVQAEAAAERLKNEKVDKIFSSSCGRAYETALHIAKRHNTEVTKLDFMREIHWGEKDTGDFVNPWGVVDEWVADDKPLLDIEWKNDGDYKDRTVVKSYNKVSDEFDKWLENLGLKRDGNYYRVVKESDDTIMLVSHGGSSSVVLSHIFNLTFPFVCKTIRPQFTAITIVEFEGKEGDLVSPRFVLLNDSRHISGITAENYFGR